MGSVKTFNTEKTSLAQLESEIARLIAAKTDLETELTTQKQRSAELQYQKQELSEKQSRLKNSIADRKVVLQNYDELIEKAEIAFAKISSVSQKLTNVLVNTQKSTRV